MNVGLFNINTPAVLGTLRVRCKDISYQIQHTVCTYYNITCGREIKGNQKKVGDFMIPAIVYARASTDHQEYSVNDQLKYIKDWAKHHGYKIVKVYIDDGISGAFVSKRPGFLSMIEDVTTDLSGAKVLLIWDSYRLQEIWLNF